MTFLNNAKYFAFYLSIAGSVQGKEDVFRRAVVAAVVSHLICLILVVCNDYVREDDTDLDFLASHTENMTFDFSCVCGPNSEMTLSELVLEGTRCVTFFFVLLATCARQQLIAPFMMLTLLHLHVC